jgi:hypothetical protein
MLENKFSNASFVRFRNLPFYPQSDLPLPKMYSAGEATIRPPMSFRSCISAQRAVRPAKRQTRDYRLPTAKAENLPIAHVETTRGTYYFFIQILSKPRHVSSSYATDLRTTYHLSALGLVEFVNAGAERGRLYASNNNASCCYSWTPSTDDI